MTFCLKPIPATGPTPLWTRAGRDKERTRDPLRCLCGQDGCRDKELKET